MWALTCKARSSLQPGKHGVAAVWLDEIRCRPAVRCVFAAGDGLCCALVRRMALAAQADSPTA